jgi:sulfur relay (sulfurtransferase) DsrF/TusC family protein
MKFSLVVLSAIAATSSAFVAQQPVAFRSAVVTQLQANAKPAASKEDDVEKTRKVINDFMAVKNGEKTPAAEEEKLVKAAAAAAAEE